ncbi:XRE family transcriptional regulator [Paraburkholderia guartelaensis]|uniref:XRE family transcriptional regulator n=1 Tax=Paraburkholderia guartelaensis TaxID=2546446 RepID=A0A4R5KZE8_9BURK|nr:helix-turn-helix transcriptional regulator [Paraburkholderia guartelaensis]TDG01501.1 XRE family transcriptional regulator [Paraburkholderia guartelaensis]
MADAPSFGRSIAEARKRIGVSQKGLAAMLKRDDGMCVSPQYLNDIEHSRRHPSTDWLITQLANVLGLDTDYMYFLAGRVSPDLVAMNASPEAVALAMTVLRNKLN